MSSWRVIYPNGNRSKLSVAEVEDDELGDWCLASRLEFETEYNAYEYMKELAVKHNLSYDASRTINDFLD